MARSVPGLAEGHRLVELETIDSTNAEAMRRGLAGEAGPLWIVARRQTAGRGRSGRAWISDPANLHASFLLTLSVRGLLKAYQLSLLAGVAMFDAIAASGCLDSGVAMRLKWPNDVLLAGRKAGGILVESSTRGQGGFAVIGIGLNLNDHPEDTALPATHLGEHGHAPAKEIFLGHLSVAVAGWLARWQEGGGFAAVRSAWLERAGPTGELCSVNLGQSRVAGRFAGLDGDGALLLLDESGQQQRYTYGDVSLHP